MDHLGQRCVRNGMGQRTATKSPKSQDSALSHVRDDGLFAGTQLIFI